MCHLRGEPAQRYSVISGPLGVYERHRWPPTSRSSSHCPSLRVNGEPEFLARAIEGDHEAYANLVRPYERVAYRVAAAITGRNADAEEAMQNGFVKAYRSLHRFRVGAAFRPWLLRIVVNEAHNVLRAERRHVRLAHARRRAARDGDRGPGRSGDRA